MLKKNIFLFFVFISCFSHESIAQADSAYHHGTVKISKPTDGKVYVKANAEYDVKGPDSFQPFPLVKDYAFPFNYSRYFREHFKNVKVDLKGQSADTVNFEFRITKKGKFKLTNIRDKLSKKTSGDFKYGGATSELTLKSLDVLLAIKEWYPAYIIVKKVGKFKGETVIRPIKTNIESKGVITVYFSIEPFDY